MSNFIANFHMCMYKILENLYKILSTLDDKMIKVFKFQKRNILIMQSKIQFIHYYILYSKIYIFRIQYNIYNLKYTFIYFILNYTF